MDRRFAWQETVLGLAVLALAALVAWQTTLIPENALYARVGPKVFPWLTVGLLALMGLLLTVQALRGGWEHEPVGDTDWHALGWLVAGLVMNVAFIGGMEIRGIKVAPQLGFVLSSTILFVCIARAFLSRQPVRDGLIGFTLALVAYVGFDRVLGYKIGSGLVENLFARLF